MNEDGVVSTRVVRGGTIRSRQGVNVPAERLSLPSITEKDRDGLERAIGLGVDFVAQSFVRSAEDVEDLRALMGGHVIPIVAKVETRPAVEAAAEIVRAADAVMVARGDLGVELPLEEIPLVQKALLHLAREAGTPSIVATQMLESMIHAPRPTRAEASDAANAVLDGADAVMLSGETAVGDFPVEAASAAARIADLVDRQGARFRTAGPTCRHADEASAIAHAAASVATSNRDIEAIACYTTTGQTARLLSAERPAVPIYAFASDRTVARRLSLQWGITPLDAPVPDDTDDMIELMERLLHEHGLVAKGRSVVMVASSPVGDAHTNLVKAHRVE